MQSVDDGLWFNENTISSSVGRVVSGGRSFGEIGASIRVIPPHLNAIAVALTARHGCVEHHPGVIGDVGGVGVVVECELQ
jgi:hypothetical protein